MQRFLNPAVNDATTSPPPLPLSWWKHTREILTSTLKILSLYNSLVFTFSHLSGVWSMAGSWWLRLGRRYFPGLNEWKKKRSGKKYTDPRFFPPKEGMLCMGHISLLICWSAPYLLEASAPLTWSDSQRAHCPAGENLFLFHTSRGGILLESSDLLVHTCLGDPSVVDISQNTQGVSHHAEMHGKPLLALSTNSVHFLSNCCCL